MKRLISILVGILITVSSLLVGSQTATKPLVRSSAHQMVFSTDKNMALIIYPNKIACTIDTTTGRPRFQVPWESPINLVQFSPGNKMLLVEDVDGAVRIFDTTEGKVCLRISSKSFNGARISYVKFSPNSKLLLLGMTNGISYLLDILAAKYIEIPYVTEIDYAKFSDTSEMVLIEWRDRRVIVFDTSEEFDLAKERKRLKLQYHTKISEVVFRSDNKRVLIQWADGMTYIYDTTKKFYLIEEKLCFKMHFESKINLLRFSHSNKVFIGSVDGFIRGFDIITKTPCFKIYLDPEDEAQIETILFSDRHKLIVIQLHDGTVHIFKSTTDTHCLYVPPMPQIKKLTFSNDSELVFIESVDRTARIFTTDPHTRKQCLYIECVAEIDWVVFNDDNSRTCIRWTDGTESIFDNSEPMSAIIIPPTTPLLKTNYVDSFLL